MKISGINQVGNSPETKNSKKAEPKPVIEQKTAQASAQDAAGSYGKAMLNLPKISFGQAKPPDEEVLKYAVPQISDEPERKEPIEEVLKYAIPQMFDETEESEPSQEVLKYAIPIEDSFPDSSSEIDISPADARGKILSTDFDSKNGHLLVTLESGEIVDLGGVPGYEDEDDATPLLTQEDIPFGLLSYEDLEHADVENHDIRKVNNENFVDLTVIREAEVEHEQKFILSYEEIFRKHFEGHDVIKITKNEWLDATAMKEALKKK